MAKALASNATFLALLFSFLILFTSFEMQTVEAKVCQRRSISWSGPCLNTGNCSRQCKNLEGARAGACHRHGWGFACFCYFNC